MSLVLMTWASPWQPQFVTPSKKTMNEWKDQMVVKIKSGAELEFVLPPKKLEKPSWINYVAAWWRRGHTWKQQGSGNGYVDTEWGHRQLICTGRGDKREYPHNSGRQAVLIDIARGNKYTLSSSPLLKTHFVQGSFNVGIIKNTHKKGQIENL